MGQLVLAGAITTGIGMMKVLSNLKSGDTNLGMLIVLAGYIMLGGASYMKGKRDKKAKEN
jgi:hypothetical protein